MRQLQKRNQRIDTLRSEARPRKRGRFGRYIYLLFLAFLAFFLLDLFVGELIYLRGEGMVTREVAVVSAGYQGTVRRIHVDEGERVAKGDVLMRVHSQGMTTDIARLSGDLADVEAKLATLRTRRDKLRTLIPIARERMEKIGEFRDKLQSLGRSGLTNNSALADVITDSFDATRDFKEMQTEAETLGEDLAHTKEARDRVRNALDEMHDIYNEGRVVAPVAGIVGRLNTKPGAGTNPGERLAEVFHGSRYVLAFVPTGAMYQVEEGDKVALRYGVRLMRGEVSKLLPLAHRLPQEFQRAFQTAQRKQLVRVDIMSDARVPPLFTKVDVTWWTSPRVTVVRAIHALRDGVAAAVAWVTGVANAVIGWRVE